MYSFGIQFTYKETGIMKYEELDIKVDGYEETGRLILYLLDN